MRNSDLSDKLYQDIRQAIEDKSFPPGSQMPTEPELSLRFNVARNTLRKVLLKLEADGLVTRKHGKGTYVRPENEMPEVTFLLPCATYFTQKNTSSELLRQYLHGAMVAANEFGYRFNTIAISSDNRNDKIDWKMLEQLTAESRVIVPSEWFFPIFELLQRKGCHVVLIHAQTHYVYDRNQYLENWVQLIRDRRNGFIGIVGKMVQAGSKKIALGTNYLNEINHPIPAGFIAGAEKYGIDHCTLDLPLGDWNENCRSQIKTWYEATHFDTLLLNSSNFTRIFRTESVNRYLELPESVRILLFDYPDSACHFDSMYGIIGFSELQIGYDAVKMFAQNAPAGTIKHYEPFLTTDRH